MSLWLKKEKTSESVTLTFTLTSFILYATACVAHTLDLIKSTSDLDQLFFASLGAYLARKVSFKNSKFSVNHDQEEKKED